ncbi:uncharacterized protein LOC135631877 isoform X2 [Musa acuminata AAA Group]|uniref:SPT2 chromatin protein n=1 Tax=Musa acuminata subsp. malaccensis TaxID=214687 RepID=A0A804I2X0_MUSAM|nr:PREDICTED: protein SPT2 homolog isoform X2 [Musa acuminata subsp. malaccensis]
MIQHHRNGFHQRPHEYEMEDYEEYEEEASEPDEEELEAPKSTKDEQDFLKLREQLKARFRQKLKKQSAGALGRLSQTQDKRTATNDRFGSFFGPSQPSIAPRVIEESRSIRETKHIMTNYSSSSTNKRDPTSSVPRTSADHQNHQRPKIVNQIKNKAQTLKDMRDYSFLLSDDADLPTAKEQPKPRSASSATSDGRMAQSSLKSKVPTGKPAKLASAGHEQKKPALSNQHVQNRVGHVKEPTLNRPKSSSNDSQKVFGDVRNGPGRTTGNIALKGKVPNQSTITNRPPRSVTNAPSMKKNVPSAKTHSSAQNHYSEQKRLPPGMDRAKTTMKQPMSSSKAEPSKQNSSRGVHNDRLNQRPAKRKSSEEEDVDDYRRAIREMFGYNPNRYAGMDEDDSDMEVGFDVIQKEERISSKIARKEDEEELRLIEEEEERERRMRTKKKLKRS